MYVTNSDSKTPIFQINQHIGNDKDVLGEDGSLIQEGDGQGIDGRQFANEVLSLDSNDNIDEIIFYINSQGGDVQQSFDIFNAISMSKHKTHAIITGLAYSCGGWIPLAADKVEMVNETGSWMCHMPYNPDNPEEKSEFMDAMYNNIAKVISSKSGKGGKVKKSIEDVKKLLKAKTYYDAEQMEKEGLIDHKVNHKGKVIRFEKDPITLNKTELNFYYKEFQSAQNKLVLEEQTKKLTKMANPKLVNRLNKIDSKMLGFKIDLPEDASDDVLYDTVVRIENKFKALNDDMMDKEKIILDKEKDGKEAKEKIESAKKVADDKEKEAKDAMCQYNTMKEAYDKMESENKTMKAEKEDAANKAKEADLKMRQERAKNLVESLAKDGDIPVTKEMPIEDMKVYLVNKATENYEDVVSTFSSIKGTTDTRIKAFKIGGSVKNQSESVLSITEKQRSENMLRIKKNTFRIEGGTKVELYDKSELEVSEN